MKQILNIKSSQNHVNYNLHGGGGYTGSLSTGERWCRALDCTTGDYLC